MLWLQAEWSKYAQPYLLERMSLLGAEQDLRSQLLQYMVANTRNALELARPLYLFGTGNKLVRGRTTVVQSSKYTNKSGQQV